MVIFPKNKILILNIQKTGSRSVRTCLQKHGLDFISAVSDRSVLQHANLKQASSYFKKNNLEFEEYKKFATVRNPWRRLYSFYNFAHKKFLEFDKAEILKESQALAYAAWSKVFNSPWLKNKSEIFYRIILSQEKNEGAQYKYIYSKDGKMPNLMEVLRYENINQDFEKITQALGLPKLTLPHENKLPYLEMDPKEIFTKQNIDLIAKQESKIIKDFNYEFDLF